MFDININRLAGRQDNHGLKLLFIGAAEELLRR
jgi:hypothetical protein